MEQESYKVLWVEDNAGIVKSTRILAADEKYNIDLVWFPNWQEARRDFDANFEDYSAIIFDALCVRGRGEAPDKVYIPEDTRSLFRGGGHPSEGSKEPQLMSVCP